MTTTDQRRHIPPDEVFTIPEAAPRLRCSPSYYREQLRLKRWPGRKIANKWRVTEADIKETLKIVYSDPIFRPRPDPVSARPGTRRRYERRNRTK